MTNSAMTATPEAPQPGSAGTRRLLRRPATVQDLMAYTYYGLRWGLAAMAFTLPVVLVVGQLWMHGLPLPTSISGYYHTGMRNWFVATLVALGLFLLLYQGFSLPESLFLNLAGLAVILVAFLPTGRDRGSTDGDAHVFTIPQLHGAFALLAFGFMAVVVLRYGPRTLEHMPPQHQKEIPKFRRAYRIIGVLMVVLPLASWALSLRQDWWLFGVEVAALWVFVAYWVAKTIEFRLDAAETRALGGDLSSQSAS
jgi:hypothetical protein